MFTPEQSSVARILLVALGFNTSMLNARDLDANASLFRGNFTPSHRRDNQQNPPNAASQQTAKCCLKEQTATSGTAIIGKVMT